jgi:nitrogen fixation protein FixH
MTDMAEMTGRKVLAITVSAFGVIIAVNFLLAYKAVSTFPGLEVPNSYVASQTFDADRAAQLALGWSLDAHYDRTGQVLELVLTDAKGAPAPVGDLSVLVGRPTEAREDSYPLFVETDGAYRAPLALNPGKWMLKVEAYAPDGTRFFRRLDLFVKG